MNIIKGNQKSHRKITVNKNVMNNFELYKIINNLKNQSGVNKNGNFNLKCG